MIKYYNFYVFTIVFLLSNISVPASASVIYLQDNRMSFDSPNYYYPEAPFSDFNSSYWQSSSFSQSGFIAEGSSLELPWDLGGTQGNSIFDFSFNLTTDSIFSLNGEFLAYGNGVVSLGLYEGVDLIESNIIYSHLNLDYDGFGIALVDYTNTLTTGDYRLRIAAISQAEYNEQRFNISGTISAVPIPASAWLFGSGLIGLAGFVRRKKA